MNETEAASPLRVKRRRTERRVNGCYAAFEIVTFLGPFTGEAHDQFRDLRTAEGGEWRTDRSAPTVTLDDGRFDFGSYEVRIWK